MTPPAISNCPTDIPQQFQTNQSSTPISWLEPTADDNETPTPMIKRTRTHEPGEKFTNGTTIVTYTFTDDARNTATCAFIVSVKCKNYY